uniref:Reverse transcriptase domain-containing protein n=1 Tax=Tanacetum cinerariifolium TaxID=118510 RepID=A0A699HL36_TANCI|nr:hypothetical protein [Tanacetum cinerariifolium]
MDQNIDFSGSDQIQTPQYPEIHPPSQEISDEVFQAKGDLMKSIQTFLEEFNYIPFEEKPKILLQAWFNFFAIKHTQPKDSNELFQKLLEDLKELAEYVNSPSRDRPNFFDNNEDHSVQNKEYSENSSNEIDASNSNQEKEGPPQDSDIRQLIREECYIEVCEEQKQNMKNTILELVEEVKNVVNVVEQPTERRTCIVESLQNFRVIHKSSISLNNTSQFSPVHAIAPILSTKEPEYSPSMGYEHPNTTPKTKSDKIIKSGVEELEENVVYQEEEEVDLEDIFQIQDIVLREKLLSINRLIANIECLNDNPTPARLLNSSVSLPISEESDNSLSDNFSPEFETFCDHTEETRSGITTTHANDSLLEYDLFCFEIEPNQERLINFVKNDISDDSSNDPLLEEVDNSIPQGFENFGNDSEGDIRFLKALLIDGSILFPNNESSESDFDNPSFPRPPPEPPDAEFDLKPDSEEEIPVVMNDIDELECLDLRDEFDDDDYSSFMFVKVFSFLLSAESEDTIFDPGFAPHRLKFLVFGYLSRSAIASHPFFEISLGKSISLISIA